MSRFSMGTWTVGQRSTQGSNMRLSTRRGGQGHEGPRSLQASATDPPRVAMPSPPCHVGRLCNGLNRAATASCHATPSTYDITILSPFATPPIYDRCCKPSWIDMTLQSSVPGGWAICSKQAILVYIRCFNYARYIVLKHCSSICWQWCTDTCSWKTFDGMQESMKGLFELVYHHASTVLLSLCDHWM